MAGITMAGSGSGLDLESIINTFVTAERTPKEARLNEKEITLNTELSGIGTLRSALADFQAVTGKLGNPDTFYQSKTKITYQNQSVDSGDGNDPSASQSTMPISIKTTGVVPKGAFNVKVNQLAQGSRIESDFLPERSSKPGLGVLYFDAGDSTFEINVNPEDTLQDIQRKINEAPDNYGISANIISSDLGAKMVYTSEKTGSANNLTVYTSDPSLDIISTAMTGIHAQDAIIEVDGNTITNDTNSFTHAVTGVVITANRLTENNAVANFSTATDSPAVKELVNEFVDSYNKLMDTINTLTNPETGTLKFDSTGRSIKQQMQNITGSRVSGTSGRLSTLYDAGISLEEGGKLAINPFGVHGGKSGVQRLDNAVANSLDDLGKLFAGTGGVATQLNFILNNNLDSKGTISQRQTLLNDNLRGVEGDREKLDRYISSFENTLRQKYTALDNTVSRYNATGDYIRSVLG